jgi:hypothetical protein
MGTRGRKPMKPNNNFVKRNYYIEERFAKALTVLSALRGLELSLMVNEALEDLINKYQPMTDIDLLTLTAKRE